MNTYTQQQRHLLEYAQKKLADFLKQGFVAGHDMDHALHVARDSALIAEREGFENVFLAELAGLLHDVGRVPEHVDESKKGIRHHELSYQVMKEWFKEDREFDLLIDSEKIQLLYAVRNHWNNVADDYELAWILRDADKLDLLGIRGIERTLEFTQKEEDKIDMDMRLKYHSFHFVHTDTARKLIEERGLMKQVDEFYQAFLKKQVKDVEL